MNCSYCQVKKAKPSIRCEFCYVRRYCTKRCQKQDTAHSNECPGMAADKKSAAASGTGYGGDANRDQQQRKAGKKQAMKRETQAWKEWQKELKAFVKKNHKAAVAGGEDASAILNTLKQVLRCQAPDWWWKQPQRNLYVTALQVSVILTEHYPKAWGDPEDDESAMAALEELAQTSNMLVKQLEKEDTNNAEGGSSKGVVASAKEWLSSKVSPSSLSDPGSSTWLSNQVSSSKGTHDKDSSLPLGVVEIRDKAAAAVAAVLETPELSMMGSHDYYRQVLRPMAFDTVEAFSSPKHFYGPGGGYAKQPAHYGYAAFPAYKKKNAASKGKGKTASQKDASNGVKASATVLWKELSTYPTALPIEYGSSIFVRALEDQMDMLRVLIIGPEDTPYANGCFLFDVTLGNDYPHGPPKVQFLTTSSFLSASDQRVRFNPNLYADGKVCLSLLGTWSGPGWQPGESTLLQVLVSLQSLILGVAEPYFNEPGFETTQGTPRGKAESDKYNKNIRKYTLQVAILPFLKSQLGTNKLDAPGATPARSKRKDPPAKDATHTSTTHFKEFADVVKQHFRLKQQVVQKQLYQWLQDDPSLEPLYTEYWNTWEQLEQKSQAQSAAVASIRSATKRAKRAKVDAPAVKMKDGVILLDDEDDDDGFEAATALAIQMSVEEKAEKGKTDEVVMLDDSDDEDDRKPAAVHKASSGDEREEEKEGDADDVVDLT